MFNVLILLLLGIAAGYALRNVCLLKKIDKSISATVLVMLFVFGVSIGANHELMDNLGRYGTHAVILALFGVAGSLLSSYLACRIMYKKNRKKGGDR